jgi:hypothetical protein
VQRNVKLVIIDIHSIFSKVQRTVIFVVEENYQNEIQVQRTATSGG